MSEVGDRTDGRRPQNRLRGLLSGVKGLVAVAGGLVTVAAAVTLVVTKIEDVSDKGPPSEAERLGQLQAGITFARFRRILADEPDVQRPVGEAPDSEFLADRQAKRYVFVRRQVYIQAVVADDSVLGFSIVARTGKIHPKFEWGAGAVTVTVGRSRVTLGERYDPPNRLGGFCGANRAQYFEAHGGSNADNAQEFAVGVSTVGFDGDRIGGAICGAAKPLSDCKVSTAYTNVIFGPEGVGCFLRSVKSKAVRLLPINTYVETAPSISLFSELLAPLEPEVQGVAAGA